MIRALREAGCSREVVAHCLAVERVAVKLAEEIAARGHRVNRRLVSLGALAHDIGRSQTHGIEHGVRGAEILRRMGMDELSRFAERHIGAGIPADEAGTLGLPKRDFVPNTVEEKIVAYADKLVDGRRIIPYDRALERFRMEFGPTHPAVGRLEQLHADIERLRSGSS